MVIGTILLGVSVLMLYQGFTGNPIVGEIQKLLAGEPAFTSDGQPIGERITGGGVRTNPVPIPDDPDRPKGSGGSR